MEFMTYPDKLYQRPCFEFSRWHIEHKNQCKNIIAKIMLLNSITFFRQYLNSTLGLSLQLKTTKFDYFRFKPYNEERK